MFFLKNIKKPLKKSLKKSPPPEKVSKKSAKNGKSAKKQNGFVKYFKDLKSEFKKVVWPSWGKVVNNTGVVLAFMVVSALFIWGIDSGLSALLKLALNA